MIWVKTILVAAALVASGILIGYKAVPYRLKHTYTTLAPDSQAGTEAILQYQKDLAEKGWAARGMVCVVERREPPR